MRHRPKPSNPSRKSTVRRAARPIRLELRRRSASPFLQLFDSPRTPRGIGHPLVFGSSATIREANSADFSCKGRHLPWPPSRAPYLFGGRAAANPELTALPATL